MTFICDVCVCQSKLIDIRTRAHKVDKVDLQQGDDGLALTAATDIPADAIVLTIPAG